MKPETAEWIDKAEGDWKVAQREMQAPDPVWNVVCFLAEQCAEKYLKGFLEEQNIAFQKIHDLVVLLNASTGLFPALEPLKPQLAHLSTFGIAARYPGVQARRFYRAAKQRFDDALLLLEMERTTAAVYLAGYSVECMLKALILSAVPQAQEAELLERFRGARAHDYEWLLQLYTEKGGARMPASVVPHFARVNSWSTDMRYTPGTIAAHEAKVFVEAAIEIMTWADRRL